MKHTYLKRLNPVVEVAACFKKIGSVEARGNHAQVYCKKGHLIRGRILQSDKDAQKYAARLARKLKVGLV